MPTGWEKIPPPVSSILRAAFSYSGFEKRVRADSTGSIAERASARIASGVTPGRIRGRMALRQSRTTCRSSRCQGAKVAPTGHMRPTSLT